MRISDWSSDVCSSDLVGEDGIGDELGLLLGRGVEHDELGVDRIAERFPRVGKRPYDTIGVVDVEPGQLGLQSWNRFGMERQGSSPASCTFRLEVAIAATGRYPGRVVIVAGPDRTSVV